jgi:hypothetical protein
VVAEMARETVRGTARETVSEMVMARGQKYFILRVRAKVQRRERHRVRAKVHPARR